MRDLPNPNRRQCVGSDLRVIGQVLDKVQCTVCGAIRRRVLNVPADFYGEAYELYAHDPGYTEESQRQESYATWVSGTIPEPSDVVEIGSGNGSLLLQLQKRWSATTMIGIEPAPHAAQAACRAGLDVRIGTAEELPPPGTQSGLCFAINVLEHTPDPRAFLRAMRAWGKRILVVCPDATEPGNEVLFYDHLHSLRPEHIRKLFADVGLALDASERGPRELGAFQLALGSAGSDAIGLPAWAGPGREMHRYLEAWRSLDETLLGRTNGVETLTCFGAGEAAGLLRAYAPQTWARVLQCAVDHPTVERFGDLPVIETAKAGRAPLLLGVRPQSQAKLATRLEGQGHRVVRWDDIIAM